MKKHIILIILLISLVGKAQNPNLQWAFSLSGTGANAKSITIDPSGDFVVYGSFSGTVDFDPGVGVSNLSAITSYAFFIAKYSPSGSLIWAIPLQITHPSGKAYSTGFVKCDNTGGIYITGSLYLSCDFDPGPAVYTLTSTSWSDPFAAKYDNNGNFVWAALGHQSAVGYSSQAYDLDIDNTNNYVRFVATTFSSPSANSYNFVGSANCSMQAGPGFGDGGACITLNKTNGSCVHYWNWPYENDVSSVAVNTVNSNYMIGFKYIQSSTNIGSIYERSSANVPVRNDAYNGGSTGGFSINKIKYDASGNYYIAGTFKGTYDMNPLPATNFISSATSNQDVFIAKYNSSGGFLWANTIGSTGTEDCFHFDLDINGNVIITGAFVNTIDFDPGAGVANLSSSGTNRTTFVASYSPSGSYNWAFSLGSVSATNSIGLDVAVSASNEIYLIGQYNGTIDFDPNAGTSIITAGSNFYVAKYSNCSGAPSQPSVINGTNTLCSSALTTFSTPIVSGATSYIWSLPGGWTGTSSTNTISVTTGTASGNINVVASNGCGSSSAQTLSVTINTAPSTPGTINGNISICSGSSNTYSVTAVSGATVYTWIKPVGWTGSSTSNIINTTAGSSSGNLTVTASNACGTSAAQVLSVTVNANPTANAGSAQTITCINNSVILNGSGVTTYSWSGPGIVSGGNTSSPLVNIAGSYSLAGSTSGCNSNTATVIVSTDTTVPTVSITATTNSICIGNSTTLTASGASTYNWNTSSTATSIVVSPTTTTNYIVTGTNSVNGCTNTINKSVGVNPLPVVTANTSASIICGPPFQGTATITANGASTYIWNTTAITTAIAVSPSVTTVYTVTGTDANGCVNSTPFTQSVSACTSVPQSGVGSSELLVYPNPTSGVITVKGEKGLHVTVYNIIGELILTAELNTDTVDLDLSDQANGIYFIRIRNIIKKLVKQ
jgi:hypothetical protein